MPQIHPIHIESAVIECVHQLVRESVLHVLFAEISVLAQQNPVIRREAARRGFRARVALYRRGVEGASCSLEVF